MSSSIKKAVIPAAGLGTRFLPATKAIPKEMIPIVDIPMIQFIVQEAVDSGIEDIVIVTGRNKSSIEDHFDFNYELEDTLSKRHKDALYEVSHKLGQMCNIISIRQKEPLGLGHAVLAAAPIVGDESFAVLLGDDLIDYTYPGGPKPCTRQLMDVFDERDMSVVGVMEVPKPEVSKYGIVGGEAEDERTVRVKTLVEKPSPDQAPSQLAMPGRYLMHAEVFEHIRNTPKGAGGEIQLTDGLQRLADSRGLLAYQFDGVRYDAGDRLGYLEATLSFGLRRPELKDGLLSIMERYLKEYSK